MARLKHPIRIDRGRAGAILSRLLYRLEEGLYPYNQPEAILPQDPSNLPPSLPRGGADEAVFLFCACYYMRGGIDSVTGVRMLSRLYGSTPDLFRPEVAGRMDPLKIKDLLRDHGLQYKAGEIGQIWVENARRLVERYEGDPRRIFAGISNYEESCERIQNDKRGGGFLGFQKKMVSMLIYFLMDAGLLDPEEFPIPVDFHVMRIFVENEIVTVEGAEIGEDMLGDDELPEVIREITLEFARRHQFDPLRLADSLWLFSSLMCSRNPGNFTDSGKYQARSTALAPRPVDWDNPTQVRSYERSCGSCPLQETCRWNVPSAPYYRWGQLIRRGERQTPPTGLLFHPYQ